MNYVRAEIAVSTATNYFLEDQGLIPSMDERFFLTSSI
jgi:hypothetical protein